MDEMQSALEGLADMSLESLWLKLRGVECVDKYHWRLKPEDRQVPYNLLIVAGGHSGHVIIDGCYYSLKHSALILCTPHQLVEIVSHQTDEPEVYMIRFEVAWHSSSVQPEAEEGGKHLNRGIFPLQSMLRLSPASPAIEKCKMLFRLWGKGNAADRFYCEAGLHELLGIAFQTAIHESLGILERAKQELEQHYKEEITIQHLAQLTGMSRYHFMRLFKEKYGKSVGDYITDLRIQEAKRLMLEEPNLPLQDIAYQAGYQNPTYFSRMFKKQVGIAPVVYLRNQVLKVAAYSWANIGQLLPLQIIPFAAPIDQYWDDYYRKKYHMDITIPLSHDYRFNEETLRASSPDLIIALDYMIPEEEAEKLKEIAPLLLIPYNTLNWRQHLRLVAEFVNKLKEAEIWLDNYDAKAQKLRPHMKMKFGEDPVLMLKISRGKLFRVGSRAATVLYDDLELKLPEDSDQADEWRQELMWEIDDLKRVGHILLSVGEEAESQNTWQALKQSERWLRVPAVSNGKFSLLPDFPWFEFPWGEYSAFSHERMLDQLADAQLCGYAH
ncbi:helix-turn-helix domain-containing protein [Paenibacillus eucommiae]|uniref:AraC-like DNA-binding protein n=1 Tax=Paenibacillus eucommiae TaxID=1355755 RepID=A0ABS4IVV7_9BACL|nr:helix-turn-helix domain-containing protein [Paenibacillus eucommiae]MBP1991648.1 AraC-like DNA-binding protein [Paenibacillus eucommiae]